MRKRTPKPLLFGDLESQSCRYPLGERYAKPLWFCGRDTGNPNVPYCEDCRKLAWVKPDRNVAKTDWQLPGRRAVG